MGVIESLQAVLSNNSFCMCVCVCVCVCVCLCVCGLQCLAKLILFSVTSLTGMADLMDTTIL